VIIVHVAESFAGGTFEFMVRLTTQLKNCHHVVIHGYRENTPLNYKTLFPEKTKFIEWHNAQRNINFKNDMAALFELIGYLKKLKDVDVVHLHSSKAGFLGRVAGCILGINKKVVYTSHGAAFLRKDVSNTKQKMYIALEKIGSILGGQVVACSDSEKEEFLKHNIKNVVSINNGIEIKKYTKYRNDTGEIIVATTGRISVQKNPKLFNEIAGYFLNDRNIKFIWFGDGELRYELSSPNIIITGWLTKDDVMDKINKIDIYLSTSLWEGLPLSVLEAMAMSKPLLLSNCVGNRDLIHGNGYLYNNIDEAVAKLNKLIKNDNLRIENSKKSRKLIEVKFTLDNMVKIYLQKYKNIGRA